MGDMSTDLDKLHAICQKTYKEQAVWFLNCFWQDFAEKEAELFWQYVLKNAELDLENHELGCGLDEMKAHVFLEKFDETLTVREMREKLRSTGAIGESERPKNVPLTHYLLYKYNVNWHELVDESRQGDNKEEMEKAERMLQEVQAAFRESEARAGEARAAMVEAQNAENAATAREAEAKQREADAVARENEAKQSEADAKKSEADAVAREEEARQREAEAVQRDNEAKASAEHGRQKEASAKASADQARQQEAVATKDADAAKAAEAEAQAAQRELEEALAELKRQEDAFNAKKDELQRKGDDKSIGVVTRNKAKNELAQLLAEDPLPLKRAKITQEAAIRKAEKATAHASATRQTAEASANAASKARAQAEADANRASQARAEATRA